MQVKDLAAGMHFCAEFGHFETNSLIRVHPGKKMPGRMGNEWNTVQHLPVLKVDNENGLVLVKG